MGWPYRGNMSISASATSGVPIVLKATASGYRVAASTIVKMYLFPISDVGAMGPMMSMATLWKGIAMVGIFPKGTLPTLPLGTSCETTTLAAQILTINEKLDSILSLKASVNLLLELPAKVNELLLLKPTIDRMNVTVEEVQTSISFLGKKYDSLLATVSAHATDMSELRTEVASLKDTVCEQAHTIQSLQTEMNDADQRGRQHIMEIHGMTVKTDEALPSILAGLADKLGIPGHQPADVVSVFRLPGKPSIKPPILVKFTSVATKDKWMQARSKLRQFSRDNPPERLYFNDSLTQTNRELFWQDRQKCELAPGAEHVIGV
ncbi:uncharacterized protein LOC115323502 [Ixodes scapularis]|uniref:uncharacterized protein LOC115323502 n=1 Tax=Ixodes scapularis TaxID=6945 RepID=UPI001AD72D6F|nr:uncharacterized protein LOC115323502 [Ixodes scapularis]